MNNKIIPATILAFALISALNTCEDYRIKKEEKAGRIKEYINEQEFDNVFVPNTDEINIEVEDKVVKK